MKSLNACCDMAVFAISLLFLVVLSMLIMPLAALTARFLMPVALAVMVVVFLVSCFSPRLRNWLENLGRLKTR